MARVRVTPVFYVYVHKKADTGEIFYIGKGNTNRAWVSNKRSAFWKNVSKKHGHIVEIIHNDLDEDTAMMLEVAEINNHKALGIKLCNLTKGGDGSTGFKFSDDQREKLKAKNNPKRVGHTGFKHSEKSKKKMSESTKGKNTGSDHYLFGKKHSDISKIKMSNSCIGISSGVKNYFHNNSLYEFFNKDFGSVLTTQYEMKKYFPDLIQQGISSICTKQRNIYKGWSVIG